SDALGSYRPAASNSAGPIRRGDTPRSAASSRRRRRPSPRRDLCATSADMAARAEEVDVVVIGLGPGGEEVAERLAEAGLAVVGVEEHLVGGGGPCYGGIRTPLV